MPLKFSSPLPPLDGGTHWIGGAPADADLEGRPIFVQFWGASCGYCLLNAPLIAEWKERYGPLGLVLLSIHGASGWGVGEMEGVVEKHGILTPCALDEEGAMGGRFQTGGIVPHYFFFDSTHRLRSRAAGTQGLHLVEASIRRSLGLPGLVVASVGH